MVQRVASGSTQDRCFLVMEASTPVLLVLLAVALALSKFGRFTAGGGRCVDPQVHPMIGATDDDPPFSRRFVNGHGRVPLGDGNQFARNADLVTL